MNNPFDAQKKRKLVFTDKPAEQVAQAYLLLSEMENLRVERGQTETSLIIHYSIEHYSHEGLRNALIKEGFLFKDSLFQKLFKHLVHYCEDIQQHNLSTPEHVTKKNEAGVFAKSYGHHSHDNHDETLKKMGGYK